jgi:hypothetical protein
MRILLIHLILFTSLTVQSQVYPSFDSEINVSINGLTFDAMEPFISADGDVLFFNNLNDGANTKLYYATKINDSTFNYIGEVNGTNQITPPYLDAVADMDLANNFYWTSTRNYPVELNNLFHGTFNAGNVTSIGRVYGDFNKNIPGWLVMDHGISYNGQFLYYNNARLDNNNCQGPCETEIGIAQKVNDSTFNQIPNSSSILQNINDTNYIYYAPCISSDDLELYYTRYPRDTVTANTLFEICVAVRSSPTGVFSIPTVLFSELISDLIEAPTLTTNKEIIYYHRKIVGSHKIVMRYRKNPSGTENLSKKESPINIYPNPTTRNLNIKTELKYQKIKLSIITLLGKEILAISNQTQIDLNTIPSGIYFLNIEIDGKIKTKKFFKIE